MERSSEEIIRLYWFSGECTTSRIYTETAQQCHLQKPQWCTAHWKKTIIIRSRIKKNNRLRRIFFSVFSNFNRHFVQTFPWCPSFCWSNTIVRNVAICYIYTCRSNCIHVNHGISLITACKTYWGLKVKVRGFQMLLNKEADRTCLHSPIIVVKN